MSHLHDDPTSFLAAGREGHRDVQGGAARAAVFGASDGLVSNVSLILGVAGASVSAGTVRIAGLAGLLAGAFSMGAGEFVSMKAQKELLERELELERTHLRRSPEYERRELAHLYVMRGVDPVVADSVAEQLMRTDDLALDAHAREELGIDPRSLGSPTAAALASFVAFAIGALIPLVPWFLTEGRGAVISSVALAALSAAAVGAVIGHFTARSPVLTALRQVAFAGVAAAVTFGAGSLLGTRVA